MRPLITYFSTSGETKKLASTLAAVVDGDLFEIRPKVPYTAADLDWHDKASRSTIEMSDTACRPPIANAVTNIGQYDTIYIGLQDFFFAFSGICENCQMGFLSFICPLPASEVAAQNDSWNSLFLLLFSA